MMSKILNTAVVLTLGGFLTFSLTAPSRAMLENEDRKKSSFHLLFRAVDAEGNSALFIPTNHGARLSKFYTTQILSKNVLYLESVNAIEDEENKMCFFSKKNLPPAFFLQEEDTPWKLFQHEQYQEKYTRIAEFLGKKDFDYSYLNDISRVKPGLLAVLNSVLFVNPEAREGFNEGMDATLQKIFQTSGKKVLPLETLADLMNLFAVSKASSDDVEDDFDLETLAKYTRSLNPEKIEEEEKTVFPGASPFYATISPPTNYQEAIRALEEEWEEEQETASILVYDGSIAKRNKHWMMPTILKAISNNEDVVAAGALHFVGEGGLLTLGTEEGIMWQVYDEKKGWEHLSYRYKGRK